MKKKSPKRITKYLKRYSYAIIFATAFIIGIIFYVKITNPKINKREVITSTQLEKIVNISELSTFTAIYNGIAQVMNEKHPDKTDYYVAYEAKVNAGTDFEKININLDNENSLITVTLPQVRITSIDVDITSLDYIFINEKRNISSVSKDAYNACREDVERECQENTDGAIFELAKQNAEKIMRALIKPFVDQVYSEYTVDIIWKEE